jgi:hypothetical protein
MWRKIGLVTIAVVIFASDVAAQDQWGLSVALTPSWQTGPGMKFVFDADRIDLSGSEVRVGFVRGMDIAGDWGLSFVNTAISDDSTLDFGVSPCRRGNCGTFLRTVDRTRMTGFEFHQFQPFKTWRERVQIGAVGAIGLGWLRGQIYKRTTSDEGDVESLNADAGELFPPSTSVMPLAKLEIAVAGIVIPGLKIRASGGFSMPGYHTFGVTLVYLIPR